MPRQRVHKGNVLRSRHKPNILPSVTLLAERLGLPRYLWSPFSNAFYDARTDTTIQPNNHRRRTSELATGTGKRLANFGAHRQNKLHLGRILRDTWKGARTRQQHRMVSDDEQDDVAAQIANLARDVQALQVSTPSFLPSLSLPMCKGRADNRSFREFLRECARIGKALGWNEKKSISMLGLCLKGEALALFQNLNNDTLKEWKLVTDALCAKLYSESNLGILRNKLQRRVQRENESVAEYGSAIKELVESAFPTSKNYTQNQRTELAIQSFRNGLKPLIKKHMVRKAYPASYDECISEALLEEQLQKELRSDRLRDEYLSSSIRAEARARELGEKVESLVAQVNAISASEPAREQTNFARYNEPEGPRPRGSPPWQRGNPYGNLFDRPRDFWQQKRNYLANRYQNFRGRFQNFRGGFRQRFQQGRDRFSSFGRDNFRNNYPRPPSPSRST